MVSLVEGRRVWRFTMARCGSIRFPRSFCPLSHPPLPRLRTRALPRKRLGPHDYEGGVPHDEGAGDGEVRRRYTDIANAQRFVAHHGERLRWVLGSRWLLWDGRRWQAARIEEIEALAKETAQAIWSEVPSGRDAGQCDEIARHAKQSSSARAVSAMIKLARSDERIGVRQADLDIDPLLFNCGNGTLDLRAWTFREHRSRDLVTKLSPFAYDDTADSPTWKQFVLQAMGGNTALAEFLQRAVGYSLTGDVREQCLFFLYGLGANGKSTFVETVRCLLGDYAMHVDSSSFLRQHGEAIRTDIARIAGARFISAAEIGPGREMDEVLVKQLTGGGRITARHLYSAPFEFDPIAKIWIEANHKPVIRGVDNAIWRRIHLIPFSVTIPPAERDRQLPERLRGELPGIFNWALDGYHWWQQEGLAPPPQVLAATAEYRQEMDLIADFLSDCCVVDSASTVWKSDLYGAYVRWSEEHRAAAISQKTFGKSLTDRGHREARIASGRYWIGIRLRSTTGG